MNVLFTVNDGVLITDWDICFKESIRCASLWVIKFNVIRARVNRRCSCRKN